MAEVEFSGAVTTYSLNRSSTDLGVLFRPTQLTITIRPTTIKAIIPRAARAVLPTGFDKVFLSLTGFKIGLEHKLSPDARMHIHTNLQIY